MPEGLRTNPQDLMQVMLPKGKAESSLTPLPLVDQPAEMEITVNQNKVNLPEEASVQNLIDRMLGEKQKGVAVAIGSSVVPRAHWREKKLSEGDEVMIIRATQGG